jgi:hypothetical protein
MEKITSNTLSKIPWIQIYKFYRIFTEYIEENKELVCKEENTLSKVFIDQLMLNNKNNLTDETQETFQYNYTDKFQFMSYPQGNYLLLLTNNILHSFISKEFPFNFCKLDGFKDQTQGCIDFINKTLQNGSLPNLDDIFIILQEEPISEESKVKIRELLFLLLTTIGSRGLLTFLGLRETPGSQNFYLLPETKLLREKFEEMHTKAPPNGKAKQSILSVGARALCKHSHRSSEGFWPNDKGKEFEKNLKASLMLERFFKECIWINIHCLPGDKPSIELRTEQGYGIRWQVEDYMFRGFLEPQSEDGHEKGWKH